MVVFLKKINQILFLSSGSVSELGDRKKHLKRYGCLMDLTCLRWHCGRELPECLLEKLFYEESLRQRWFKPFSGDWNGSQKMREDSVDSNFKIGGRNLAGGNTGLDSFRPRQNGQGGPENQAKAVTRYQTKPKWSGPFRVGQQYWTGQGSHAEISPQPTSYGPGRRKTQIGPSNRAHSLMRASKVKSSGMAHSRMPKHRGMDYINSSKPNIPPSQGRLS